MNEVTCLECGTPFANRRALHAHLKAHELTVGDYYVKHFPKYDLLTNEPIPFKDLDDYLVTDFRNKKNMHQWLRGITEQERWHYCQNVFRKHMEGRNYKFAPNHLYFFTHPRLPKMEFFNKEWLEADFKERKLIQMFTDSIPECPDFGEISKDLRILVDTREQMPLEFGKIPTLDLKLDFGDYTASGDHYSYIFVDRKSEGDFKGTVSQGFDRFCRELDRVRELQSYLYIVVESDFKQIFANNNKLGKKKNDLKYIFKNMRRIIIQYSDVCQFIFSGSRDNSSMIVPYLLENGEKFQRVDLPYYFERYKCLG